MPRVDDGEPEPRSARIPASRLVDPIEPLEETRDVLRRDPRLTVGNGQADDIVADLPGRIEHVFAKDIGLANRQRLAVRQGVLRIFPHGRLPRATEIAQALTLIQNEQDNSRP